MRSGVMLFLLAAPLVAAGPARAAVFGSPPVPITKTIDIQPIDVCNSSGTSCAPTSFAPVYEAYADLIFQQAGVGLVFLPATKFIPASSDPTNWLNPTIDASGSDAFDVAHQLMRLPGHGQPTSNTTAVLNLWFVDTLKVSSGPTVYGTGFIGGNGAIVATAPNPVTGALASVDTLAHEVGHNLGLTHVDDTPLNGTTLDTSLNLLYGGGTSGENPFFRTLPVLPCQVAPYSCPVTAGATVPARPLLAATPRGTKILDLASTAGVKIDMFATGPNIPAGDYVTAVSTSGVTLALSTLNADPAGALVSFASPPPTDELSTGVVPGESQSQATTTRNPLYASDLGKITILPTSGAHPCVSGAPPGAKGASFGCSFTLDGALPSGITLTGYDLNFLGVTDISGSATIECTGHAVNEAGVASIAGGNESLGFTLAAPCGGQIFDVIDLSYTSPFTMPVSADYDFSNGVASRAGFDSSGTSDSQDPISLSIVGTPSFLPDTGLPLTNIADLDFEGQFPSSVPEPPALVVLISSLALLTFARRRSRAIG